MTDESRGSVNDRKRERSEMVERQLVARGIRDLAVLEAMAEVPRERFLRKDVASMAYADRALPIEEGQTISQPYVVALMLEAAEPSSSARLLEIGTGSGYAAAVASRAVGEVFTVERHSPLAERARERFRKLGYDNIRVRVGDGTLGWSEHAPYDAVIVTAGGPDEVPPALVEQLAPGGSLVIPMGTTRTGQDLVRFRRSEDGRRVEEDRLGAVRFVPLVGESGWDAEPG